MTQEETNGQTQNLALSVRPPSGLVSGKVTVTQVVEGAQPQKPNHYSNRSISFDQRRVLEVLSEAFCMFWGDQNMY